MTDSISSTAHRAPDYVREIEQEIARVIGEVSKKADVYGTDFSALSTFVSESILGGKLLRPKLLMGAFDALEKQSEAARHAALQIAVAVELLHFSFLLHDDVIDGDLMRRGRLNLIGMVVQQQNPEYLESGTVDAKHLHWAHTNGILMGNILLSMTHQMFARQNVPHETHIRLLDLLERTVTESVAGEYLDVGLSNGVVSSDLNTVLEMSRLKTATYTFELPLRAAAILAGLPPGLEKKIGEVGQHLGIVFQLQDDFLSTFGDALEHGKDIFSDLREGKETAIIAYARTTDAWPNIEVDFGRPDLNREKGEAIRSQLVSCGAEDFTRVLIEDQTTSCARLMESLNGCVPSELVELITRLLDSLKDRRS